MYIIGEWNMDFVRTNPLGKTLVSTSGVSAVNDGESLVSSPTSSVVGKYLIQVCDTESVLNAPDAVHGRITLCLSLTIS